MVKDDLPIEVGQVVESRSRIIGYRGAWFRCKITKISSSYGGPFVALEYLDFPDEKIKRIQLYQRIPSVRGVKSNEKQMMVRPSFPPVYRTSEKPDVSNISGLAVLAEDEWKVGDLVDWWADYCYWSGRVIKVLDNDKLQIELFPPPEGEGSTYDYACSKDLRPSLDWFPESGWTLPFIPDGEKNRHCAQLIMPAKEGRTVNISAAGETRDNITAGGSSNISNSSQTQPRSSSAPLEVISDTAAEGLLGTANSRMIPDPSGLGVQRQKDKEKDAATALEKFKNENGIRLNSTFSDTLEDAVLDLEKLATRVRMYQDIVEVWRHPKTSKTLNIPQSRPPSIPKWPNNRRL